MEKFGAYRRPTYMNLDLRIEKLIGIGEHGRIYLRIFRLGIRFTF